jgi:hypothetical protein
LTFLQTVIFYIYPSLYPGAGGLNLFIGATSRSTPVGGLVVALFLFPLDKLAHPFYY